MNKPSSPRPSKSSAAPLPAGAPAALAVSGSAGSSAPSASSLAAGAGLWDPRRDVLWNLVHRDGVGPQRARRILRQLGLLPGCRSSETVRRRVDALNLEERAAERRRRQGHSRRVLERSGCTRAMRRRAGLPVRGQRTKTNAKTSRRRNRARFERARRG